MRKISDEEQQAINKLVKAGKACFDDWDKMYHLKEDFRKEIDEIVLRKIDRYTKVRAGKYISNTINFNIFHLEDNERKEYIKDAIKEIQSENRNTNVQKLINELVTLRKYSFIDFLNYHNTGNINIQEYSELLQHFENKEKITALKDLIKPEENESKKEASKDELKELLINKINYMPDIEAKLNTIIEKIPDLLLYDEMKKKGYVAALWLIVFELKINEKPLFKLGANYNEICKVLNVIFSKDTGAYKPNKVKNYANKLKRMYTDIDNL